MTEVPKVSRAVMRTVVPGFSHIQCAGCPERIVFKARKKQDSVVCNVYVDGVWQRVEHFHAECYAGQYGEPDTTDLRGKHS